MIEISHGDRSCVWFTSVLDLNNPPRAAIKLALSWRHCVPVLHQQGLRKALLVRGILKVILLSAEGKLPQPSIWPVSVNGLVSLLNRACRSDSGLWIDVMAVETTALFSYLISLPLCLSLSAIVSVPIALWRPSLFEPLIPVSGIIAATFRS